METPFIVGVFPPLTLSWKLKDSHTCLPEKCHIALVMWKMTGCECREWEEREWSKAKSFESTVEQVSPGHFGDSLLALMA